MGLKSLCLCSALCLVVCLAGCLETYHPFTTGAFDPRQTPTIGATLTPGLTPQSDWVR